ncbi:MAG: hypothetical protein ABIS00_12820 [Gemmatimonadales bacterium]
MSRYLRFLKPAAIAAVVFVLGCRAPFEPDPVGVIPPPPPGPPSPLLPFRLGSFGADFAKAVAVDPSGSAYVTSSFSNTLDFDPGSSNVSKISQGGTDIAIAKYWTDGSLAWVLSFGGVGADIPYDVKVMPNGTSYVVGYQSGGALCSGKVIPNAGGRDAFIARISPAGVCEWALGIGGTLDDEARNLTVEPNGDIVVTGAFRGSVDFDAGGGATVLVSRGGSDVFVARYSAAGAFQQVVQFGGIDDDAGSAIARTSEGDLIVGGEFRASATFGSALAPVVLVSAGVSDYFVTRLATGLGLQWAIRGGGTGTDLIGTGGIIADPNGTILVTGLFSDVADVDPGPSTVLLTSQGLSDIFLVRYDGAGVWSGLAQRIGGTGSDGVQGFARGSDGNLYLSGWFQGEVDFDPGSAVKALNSSGTSGAADGFVLSLSQAAEFRWVAPVGSVIAGDANFSIASGLAVTGDGAVWAVGRFFGLADLDPATTAVQVQSLGDADEWVVRYQAANGTLLR